MNKHVFAPGMALLRRLTYPQKFLLISVALALPLALAIGVLIHETAPRITLTQRELAGIRYLRALMVLLERTLESQERQDAAGRPTADAAIDQALSGLQVAASVADAELATLAYVPPIEARREALRAALAGGDRLAIQQAHVALVAEIHGEIGRVGNVSNLILDPELVPHSLMDLVVIRYPDRMLILSELALVEQQFTANSGDLAQLNRLIELVGQLEANYVATGKGAGTIATGSETLHRHLTPTANISDSAAGSLIDILRGMAMLSTISGGSRSLAGAARLYTAETGFRHWDVLVSALDSLLQARVNRLVQLDALVVGVGVVLLVATAYVLTAFYLTVMQAVSRLDTAARRMAAGQLDNLVAVDTRDELGQVVTAFNRVATALVESSAQQAAAEAERARLQEQVLRAQAGLLVELSAPLIPLGEHVLLLPLIGAIDAARVEHITMTMLTGVSTHRARILILDMTGVRVVDQQMAEALTRALQGVRLLGARSVLVGIQPGVAEVLVAVQFDLREVTIFADLRRALIELQEAWPAVGRSR